MRIITWNCNMAYRKKAEYILAFEPDIVVVPECEHPDKLKFKYGIKIPTDIFWYGKNLNKGLGVFSYCNFKFKLLNNHNPELKTIIPLSVSNGQQDFVLIAIWAYNPQDKDGAYVTQIWKALHHYNSLLANNRIVLAGDFNSNTIWDKPRREGNHSTVVKQLEEKNIHSIYHKFFKKEQGREAHPTWYMYRHEDKPYHLDYCFASADIVEKVTDVQVGDYETWNAYSDHAPLMVTFDL